MKFFLSVLLASAFLLVTTHSVQAQNSCADQEPVNTQFRFGDSNGDWVDGTFLSSQNLYTGTQIDVNCFSKNGYAQLSGGVVDVTYPDGNTKRVSNRPQIDDFTVSQSGTYSFRCSSTTINNCSNTDSVTVRRLASPSPSIRPTPTPSPAPADPSPTPKTTPHKSACEELDVVGGNNSLVPAKVTLRARGSDNKGNIQRYKFYFGDGEQEETDNVEIQHTYESSGTFIARVDVKDSQGNWKTDNSCEATVKVKASSVESHKAGCSDIFIHADNNAKAPSNVEFKVTGYDNKGGIQKYKLDFGNDVVKESDGQNFEQRYEKAGTYTVRAYIKDSEGNWRGGEDSCKRNVYINTKPLSKQPETGTPTSLTLLGITSGVAGVGLRLAKKKFLD